MEFLTLNDAQAQTKTRIGRAILRTVLTESDLLNRLSWVQTDHDTYCHDQVQITGERINRTTALSQYINKMIGIPLNQRGDQFVHGLANATRAVEGSINLQDIGHGLDVIGFSSVTVGELVARMGRFWNPNKCVFMISASLLMGGVPDWFQGASIYATIGNAYDQITCVSLDPVHGLFGIGKGQIPNCPYSDVNEDPRPDFGPVLGWQIESGIKQKADPSRPEEVRAADKDGMLEITRISWTGAFGIRNKNAGVRARILP